MNLQKAAACAWLFAPIKEQVCAKGVHAVPCKNSKKWPKPSRKGRLFCAAAEGFGKNQKSPPKRKRLAKIKEPPVSGGLFRKESERAATINPAWGQEKRGESLVHCKRL